MTERHDPLVIAGREFHSRLLVGTGKFASLETMAKAILASRSEIVTVSLRRVEKGAPTGNIMDHLDPDRFLILPNTSGARDAEEAVRLARLAKAGGISDWIKLEVTPHPMHLLPDPVETLKAAVILVKEGFRVLPYINADPVLARRLAEAGTVTVMPLGAPIGTNRGLKTADFIRLIIDEATVPVIVDAGLGAPSHASAALEMGADAVLVNTAIATAEDPVMMANAFRLGVEAGRFSFLSGAPPEREEADPSSPLTGFLGES